MDEVKLQGFILKSDMSWKSIAESLVLKAYKKLWMIRRLNELGASEEVLLDVSIRFLKSESKLQGGSMVQAELFDALFCVTFHLRNKPIIIIIIMLRFWIYRPSCFMSIFPFLSI